MFQSDADEVNYPASLTKILSAIVVLESGISLEQTVIFTDEMLAGLYEAGAAVVGYSAGDEVSVKDLLYGLMLPSGADCANALAFTVGGSIDGFVSMMNDKAAAVGMVSSHFANPTGLHSTEQYTTARDLTVLLRHCLANPDFFTIYTTASRKNAPTASLPDGVWVTNYILGGGLDISFEGGSILGAKTGFTTPAGQCLSSYTVIGGRRFILITMGAGREFDFNDKYSLNDALHLYILLSKGSLGV
ncbi:MAG: D-alanyl-D-alanine carboxypeptidase [Oscillospiraceae bacterium]|nr:D-alanyl-D-alanine carboxypeptidase [Oscillospiraceae bacterium]